MDIVENIREEKGMKKALILAILCVIIGISRSSQAYEYPIYGSYTYGKGVYPMVNFLPGLSSRSYPVYTHSLVILADWVEELLESV